MRMMCVLFYPVNSQSISSRLVWTVPMWLVLNFFPENPREKTLVHPKLELASVSPIPLIPSTFLPVAFPDRASPAIIVLHSEESI